MKKNMLSGGTVAKAYGERIKAIRAHQKFDQEAKKVLYAAIKTAQRRYAKYMSKANANTKKWMEYTDKTINGFKNDVLEPRQRGIRRINSEIESHYMPAVFGCRKARAHMKSNPRKGQ